MLKRITQRFSPGELIQMTLDWGWRRLTASKRALPDFLIIGAQRCGTTSLYKYLVQHPQIEPAFIKETHFFDKRFSQGLDRYRAYFPLEENNHEAVEWITGEATPYYLFDPHVPKRIAEVLPAGKLIILLRDPVERAYSHYQFELQTGKEHLPFDQAIERELEKFPVEEQRVLNDENYYNDIFSRFSYLARGRYLEQIQRWEKFFPKDQFLIIRSDNLYQSPGEVLSQTAEFLEIGQAAITDRKPYNAASYPPLPAEIRFRLDEYFLPYNLKLEEYLQRDFGWGSKGTER